MTADKFTEAAADAAADLWTPIHTTADPLSMPERRHRRIGFTMGAEWARTHLAAQETADGGYGTRSTEAIRGWTGAWPAAQEPTDAECIYILSIVCSPFGEEGKESEWAPAAIQRCREAMMSARAARRDEGKRDD